MANIIRLRTILVSDTAQIVKWRNSPTVARWLYSQEILTEEMHLNWLEKVVNNGRCSQFVIEECATSAGIGTVFIKNIDRENSKGEFGIYIGEENARGKGYAAQAARQILLHAFADLELNRVYLTVQHDNIAAIKSYQKAGFEHEGVLRQDFMRYDGYCDVICMAALRQRWQAAN